jgi:hypothetical protein
MMRRQSYCFAIPANLDRLPAEGFPYRRTLLAVFSSPCARPGNCPGFDGGSEREHEPQ